MVCHGISHFRRVMGPCRLLIHRYTHKPFNYLDHMVENTLATTIMATYAWSKMGRLGVISCILIGCIFLCLGVKSHIQIIAVLTKWYGWGVRISFIGCSRNCWLFTFCFYQFNLRPLQLLSNLICLSWPISPTSFPGPFPWFGGGTGKPRKTGWERRTLIFLASCPPSLIHRVLTI